MNDLKIVLKSNIKTIMYLLVFLVIFSLFLLIFSVADCLSIITVLIAAFLGVIAVKIIDFRVRNINKKYDTAELTNEIKDISSKLERAEKHNVLSYEEFCAKRSAYFKRIDDNYFRDIYFSKIANMNGYEFEKFVARFLKVKGYTNIDLTPQSGDYGADVIAVNPEGERIAIQCKCYSQNNPIGIDAVQQVVSAKAFYGCTGSAVYGTSRYTPQAVKMARINQTSLVLISEEDCRMVFDPNYEKTSLQIEKDYKNSIDFCRFDSSLCNDAGYSSLENDQVNNDSAYKKYLSIFENRKKSIEEILKEKTKERDEIIKGRKKRFTKLVVRAISIVIIALIILKIGDYVAESNRIPNVSIAGNENTDDKIIVPSGTIITDSAYEKTSSGVFTNKLEENIIITCVYLKNGDILVEFILNKGDSIQLDMPYATTQLYITTESGDTYKMKTTTPFTIYKETNVEISKECLELLDE